MRTSSQRAFLAAILVATSACASAGSSQPEDISPTRFAPALGIDLKLMTKTASGLYLADDRVGSGDSAQTRQRVTVRYTGWLADGTKIDSNADGLEFRLGSAQVIRGWDIGIAGMKVGGIRQLVIPPELGYGFQDRGPIPRASVLVFRIELIRVRS